MSRDNEEIEEAFDKQKKSDYDLIKKAGFDSAEIWDLWHDSDEDVNTFINYLHELEVQGLSRMNEIEDEDGN